MYNASKLTSPLLHLCSWSEAGKANILLKKGFSYRFLMYYITSPHFERAGVQLVFCLCCLSDLGYVSGRKP